MIPGTVTTEGQITIPIKELGEFKSKPGTRVSFEAVGDQIVCKEVGDEEICYDDMSEEEYMRAVAYMVAPEWNSEGDSVYDDL